MKTKYLFIAGLALITAAACNKNAQVAEEVDGMSSQEIIIAAKGEFAAEVMTKGATEVTLASLSTLNVTATKADAVVSGFDNVTFTKGAGDKFKGGKYWPSTDGSWSFVAANTTIGGTAAAPTLTAANAGTDIICGFSATPTHKAEIGITLEHIFAQVGTVTMRAPEGYTVTGCYVTIAPKTSGTYAIKTNAWTPGAAGAAEYIFGTNSTGIAVTAAAGGTTSDDNDLWLVPGDYTLTCHYTITKGDYTNSFTKTADVTLVRGKNNNIGLTGGAANIPAPDDIAEITFSVTVTPWSDNAVAANFS